MCPPNPNGPAFRLKLPVRLAEADRVWTPARPARPRPATQGGRVNGAWPVSRRAAGVRDRGCCTRWTYASGAAGPRESKRRRRLPLGPGETLVLDPVSMRVKFYVRIPHVTVATHYRHWGQIERRVPPMTQQA